MAISFDKQISVSPDVLITDVGGEAVLLNLKSEHYFGLDEVGTRMWSVLTTSESIQAAFEELQAEYDVDAEKLRQDLDDLIERLVEHELVEISSR